MTAFRLALPSPALLVRRAQVVAAHGRGGGVDGPGLPELRVARRARALLRRGHELGRAVPRSVDLAPDREPSVPVELPLSDSRQPASLTVRQDAAVPALFL